MTRRNEDAERGSHGDGHRVPLSSDHPIVLFDGFCRVCNGSVDWIVARDQRKRIRFASLQSAAGKNLLEELRLSTAAFSSLILIEGSNYYTRSTAALRIARMLRFPWPIVYGLIVIPRFIRDAVYDTMASHRYRWFGKVDARETPPPELKERFLE